MSVACRHPVGHTSKFHQKSYLVAHCLSASRQIERKNRHLRHVRNQSYLTAIHFSTKMSQKSISNFFGVMWMQRCRTPYAPINAWDEP